MAKSPIDRRAGQSIEEMTAQMQEAKQGNQFEECNSNPVKKG